MSELHLVGAIVALAGAVVALWKWGESKSARELEALRKALEEAKAETTAAKAETNEWRQMWSGEVKERARDAEKFLRALDKKRAVSSAPPPTSK